MKYTITQIKGGTDNCYIISNGDNAILFDTASGNNLTILVTYGNTGLLESPVFSFGLKRVKI